MNIVADAVSDIFLSVADMIFARKSDKGSRAEHEKKKEKEKEKEDRHDQSR